jgi:excisionase family DNA binding protein
MTRMMTTADVADYLRIKERKVYELVSQDAIPVSRATGKLLFPREMVEAWVRLQTRYRDGIEGLERRPAVLAGSHDPLLDWALRESGSEIASFYDGSLDGLARLADGKALAAGMHVFEPDAEDWNLGHVADRLPGMPVVVVEWAWRNQGLVVPAGNPRGIRGLADLDGLPFMPRQEQSGSRILLQHLLRQAGRDFDSLTLVDPPARNEADVALAVIAGQAAAGFAVETVARQFRLDFVPLFRERYDLVVWRREFFEPPLQRLLSFCRTPAFADRAGALGGYDTAGLGRVHYNGP